MKVLWGESLGSVSSLIDMRNEGFVELWTKFIVVIPHLWGMKWGFLISKAVHLESCQHSLGGIENMDLKMLLFQSLPISIEVAVLYCCSLLISVSHTNIWSMIHCSPATCFLFCTTTWIIITSKYNCHTTPHIQQNRKSSNPTVRRAFFVPRILVIPVLRPLVHMFTPLPIVPTVKWCLNNVSHKVF